MLVILTLVIALFTVLVFLVYERIEWLTGAMETHSDLMLKIEARRGIQGQSIELIWWDPTIEAIPTSAAHGEPVKLERIYCAVPPRLRQVRPTWKARFSRLWLHAKHGPAI